MQHHLLRAWSSLAAEGRCMLAGVVQMDAGIAMSWFNQRYFRDNLSMIFEFVPQV
jgi:hypothetical protein